MAIRNALPFEFPTRWTEISRLVAGFDVRAADHLDQRDRDLEDFLADINDDVAVVAAGIGRMVVLSATGDSIASGGDFVTFDSVVYDSGFAASTGQSVAWPTGAVGAVSVEIKWASYTSGGTVEIEVDGTVPPWGVVGNGSGSVGRGVIPVHVNAGSIVKLKVTQSSGSAQTADVTCRFWIADPTLSNAPASLLLWLDASQIGGIHGASLSTWDDSSGNGYHFAQTTGANQPTYQTNVLNGLPGVLFDGSTDWMSHGAALLDADGVTHTMFGVVTVSSLASQLALMSVLNSTTGAADQGWEWSISSAGSHVYRHQSGAGTGGPNEVYAENAGAVSVGSPIVLHAQRSATAIRVGVNGSWGSWSAYPDYDPGGFGSTWLGLMRVSNLPYLFAGHIHEIKVYDADMTDVQSASVLSDLRTKWGI